MGDANNCSNIEDNTYDFVHASHLLEHMDNPHEAFRHWVRICKPKGYIIAAVPHEIFYEKCNWPSHYNGFHRTTWTLEWKSNLPHSIHTPDFLLQFERENLINIIRLETILENFDFTRFNQDQTLESAICQIDFVVRKCF